MLDSCRVNLGVRRYRAGATIMRIKKKLSVLVVVISIIFLGHSSQQAATLIQQPDQELIGRVIEGVSSTCNYLEITPVSAAEITVTTEGMTKQFVSDQNGWFKINLAVGVYDIEIKKTGYKKLIIKQVRVDAAHTKELQLRLPIAQAPDVDFIKRVGSVEL